jgi:transposase
MSLKKITENQVIEIIKDYESGLFIREIARKFNVSNTTIKNYLKKAGIELKNPIQEIKRSAKSRIGIKNHAYKNGKKNHKKGYVFVNVGPSEYELEHRFVMEKMIERKLLKSEVVHHINGIKGDNREENLFLFKNTANHNKYHRAIEKGERMELKYEY